MLYGDVPLIRTACLEKLVASAGAGALALLTVNLDQATGYGRIVRAEDGRVAAIVEHNDATPELLIREANFGSHGRAGRAAPYATGCWGWIFQRAARILPDRCGGRCRCGREHG